jgi:hypothetical protein
MAKQYIVLFALAPDQGPLIKPADEGEPPVIVDEEVLFASPSDLTNEQRAAILIARGGILPLDDAEHLDDAKVKAKKLEHEGEVLLRKTVLTRR